MKNPLNIRQNFYQGQSVSATNLTQLQDYSDNARNLIVSDILGYGIVSGFDVIKANKDNFTLSISSGLAYTQNGVRLETDKPKELFIKDFVKSADLPSGEAIITRYLAMSLDYDKTKPVTDSFSNSVFTEWSPTATPVLYDQAELITMNDILLAEIQINEYGISDIIDRRKDFLDFNVLTNTVATNKTEVDKKVTDNTSAIATTNTAVAKNTAGVASNKSSVTNLSSILSKGSDGSAVLIGDGFSISSNSNKPWYLGSSDFYIHQRSSEGIITASRKAYIYTPGIYLNANFWEGATPFTFGGSGGLDIYTSLGLNGNPSNINLNPHQPTGKVTVHGTPIIETGSVPNTDNSGGTYTKFYDGTMICYLNTTTISVHASKVWIFPSVFIETPVVTGVQFRANFASTKWNLNSVENTRLIYSLENRGVTVTELQITVLGRWK